MFHDSRETRSSLFPCGRQYTHAHIVIVSVSNTHTHLQFIPADLGGEEWINRLSWIYGLTLNLALGLSLLSASHSHECHRVPVNIRNRFGAIKTELKSVFIIKAGGRCRSRAVENRRKILDLKVRENARHDLCLIKENNCFDSFHLHLFLALCVLCFSWINHTHTGTDV